MTASRCKVLNGNKKAGYTPCNAPMFHLKRGGIEYDYCRVCYPKIDPEMKFSKPIEVDVV